MGEMKNGCDSESKSGMEAEALPLPFELDVLEGEGGGARLRDTKLSNNLSLARSEAPALGSAEA